MILIIVYPMELPGASVRFAHIRELFLHKETEKRLQFRLCSAKIDKKWTRRADGGPCPEETVWCFAEVSFPPSGKKALLKLETPEL